MLFPCLHSSGQKRKMNVIIIGLDRRSVRLSDVYGHVENIPQCSIWYPERTNSLITYLYKHFYPISIFSQRTNRKRKIVFFSIGKRVLRDLFWKILRSLFFLFRYVSNESSQMSLNNVHCSFNHFPISCLTEVKLVKEQSIFRNDKISNGFFRCSWISLVAGNVPLCSHFIVIV